MRALHIYYGGKKTENDQQPTVRGTEEAAVKSIYNLDCEKLQRCCFAGCLAANSSAEAAAIRSHNNGGQEDCQSEALQGSWNRGLSLTRQCAYIPNLTREVWTNVRRTWLHTLGPRRIITAGGGGGVAFRTALKSAHVRSRIWSHPPREMSTPGSGSLACTTAHREWLTQCRGQRRPGWLLVRTRSHVWGGSLPQLLSYFYKNVFQILLGKGFSRETPEGTMPIMGHLKQIWQHVQSVKAAAYLAST